MSAVAIAVALVGAERLGELAYAQHNTRALLRRGAIERGRRQYPFLVALHALWLLSLLVFVPAERTPVPALIALYLLLQVARFWVLASLGPFWTTRIITLPETPLVRTGPYRFLRHPNYAVVVGEIAVLPLAFGAWRLALVFSLANAAVLAWRIRVEDRVLAPRRG